MAAHRLYTDTHTHILLRIYTPYLAAAMMNSRAHTWGGRPRVLLLYAVHTHTGKVRHYGIDSTLYHSMPSSPFRRSGSLPPYRVGAIGFRRTGVGKGTYYIRPPGKHHRRPSLKHTPHPFPIRLPFPRPSDPTPILIGAVCYILVYIYIYLYIIKVLAWNVLLTMRYIRLYIYIYYYMDNTCTWSVQWKGNCGDHRQRENIRDKEKRVVL